MNSKIFCLAAMTLLFFICDMAEAMPPQSTASFKPELTHVPVTSLRQNEKLVVRARINGAKEQAVFVRLYYKPFNGDSFRYVEMRPSGDSFWGQLTSERFKGGNFSYFILAMLPNKKVVTFPGANPYGNPIEVQVTGGSVPATAIEPKPAPAPPEAITKGSGAPDSGTPLLLLSPEKNEKFNIGQEVVVAVSFLDSPDKAIDMNSITLFIDNVNVTINTEITENILTYTSATITPGAHTALVQGYYKSGMKLPSVKAPFIVKRKKSNFQDKLPFKGRLYAESRHESASGIGYHDSNMGGYLSGKQGILKYNARLYLTSSEDPKYQTRNRYSLNLDTRFAGLSIGDVYPRLNDLMLWGKRVRGIHGRLRFGIFNVDLVTGQTARKIKPGFVTRDTVAVDSLVRRGSFSQNLFGLRASFGSGKNFQLGFDYLKVKDKATDIQQGQHVRTPRDNVVIGSDLLIGFFKRRVEFRAGVAFSLVTDDIYGGPIQKDTLDKYYPELDIPVDPSDYKNILIVNLSTRPLDDPRKGKSLAMTSSFRFNFFNNNLVAGYKIIGGEYLSLGNSYLRNNIRGFFIQDRIKLWQNKLYLNLGFDNYDDNFRSDDLNSPTGLQTINTGFSIYPGQGWPTFNVNMRNYSRKKDIDFLINGADTTFVGEQNDTRDLTLQVNYNTQIMNLKHAISFSFINSARNDQFLPSAESASNIQMINIRTNYQIPLVTTINFARNDNNFANGLNTFKFNMIGLKGEYPFFNNRLTAHAALNFTSASGGTGANAIGGAVTDYKRTAFNTGARFDITPQQLLGLEAGLISFQDNGFTRDAATVSNRNPSFTDSVIRFYYEQRF